MKEKDSLTMKSQTRIASIDVMRALTMLLIPYEWFSLLMIAGFFLVWMDCPRQWTHWLKRVHIKVEI